MRRRDLIKGSIVVAATSLIAMPVIAEAVELDEVAIIRKMKAETVKIGEMAELTEAKFWALDEGSPQYRAAEKESERAEAAFVESWKKIDNYPVKTIKGLKEKLLYFWDENDLQYMAGKVAKDINRLVALT